MTYKEEHEREYKRGKEGRACVSAVTHPFLDSFLMPATQPRPLERLCYAAYTAYTYRSRLPFLATPVLTSHAWKTYKAVTQCGHAACTPPVGQRRAPCCKPTVADVLLSDALWWVRASSTCLAAWLISPHDSKTVSWPWSVSPFGCLGRALGQHLSSWSCSAAGTCALAPNASVVCHVRHAGDIEHGSAVSLRL